MTPTKPVPELPPMPASVPAGRMPNWDLHHLVHRGCPVCGGDRAEPICRRPDRLLVSRCTACAMTYLADVPAAESLAEFYRDYARFKQFAPAQKSWLRRLLRRRDYDPYVEILRRTGGVARKRVCEFGCAFGTLLFRLRELGADVCGVELDEQALTHLQQEGIATAQTLEGQEKFEVICALQVIEHLTAPGEWIQGVSAALVENGRLLLALPNGGEGDKCGPHWLGYRVDLEHLNYFSVASLSALLARHDLYVEYFWEYLQANLPGDPAPPPPRKSWQRVADLARGRESQPCFDHGTFVLCVLAKRRGR